MKITFILPSIDVSGGIKCTFELANQLQKKGHDVTIVYPILPPRNKMRFFDIRAEIVWIYSSLKRLFSSSKPDWIDVFFKIKKVLTINEFSIPNSDILIGTWWYDVYTMKNFSNKKGKKVHFIRAYEEWGGPKEIVDEVYSLPFPKIVIANWMVKFFKEKFSANILGIVPDTINFDQFDIEKPTFERHDPIRIGVIYSQAPVKGLNYFIDAMKIVKNSQKKFRLVLFGHRLKKDHKAEFKKLDPDYEYTFLPVKEKIAKIYHSLDIFVMPSVSEGFPAPPSEAMACGVATVLTDVGAIREVAEDMHNSLIVPPKDPNCLAEKIILLIDNEDLRRTIAEKGYRDVRKKLITWEKSSEILEDIFKSIL